MLAPTTTAPTFDGFVYDLAIVGGGPAGLSGAIAARTEGLSTIVLERGPTFGGRIRLSPRVDNIPGWAGKSGLDVATDLVGHAHALGAVLIPHADISARRVEAATHILTDQDGMRWAARSILLTTGQRSRVCGIADVDRFVGLGIVYGQGVPPFGPPCVIVGGSNAAGQQAISAAEAGRSVVLVSRSPLLSSMSQYLIDKIVAMGIPVRVQWDLVGATGKHGWLHALHFLNQDGGLERIETQCGHLFIGAEPDADWTGALMHDGGCLLEERFACRTAPGVFCAGDVRHGATPRVAFAMGDAAAAVSAIWHYLHAGATGSEPAPPCMVGRECEA